MTDSFEGQSLNPDIQLSGDFERIRGQLKDALLELDKFEKEQIPNTGDLCLHRFAVVVGALTDYAQHPSDMDKALSNKEFFTQMKTLVDGIKRLDMIKSYEKRHTDSIAGEAGMFRRYLLSIELYLASR